MATVQSTDPERIQARATARDRPSAACSSAKKFTEYPHDLALELGVRFHAHSFAQERQNVHSNEQISAS
jgi:hypothetical protein